MKLQLYIILFISGLFITSCTDVVQLELEDPAPVLVVDGFVSNLDTVQYVRLSSLENYFAEQPPNYAIFKTAVVTLRENTATVGTYVYNDTQNRFEISYQGIIGNEYQVHVSLPDGTSYLSASEVMESTVEIDSIWFDIAPVDGPSSNEGDVVVNINTQEPPGVGDNYQWKSYVNGEYNFQAEDIFVSDDRIVDGQYVVNLEIYSMDEETYLNYLAESPTNQVIVRIEQLKISLRYLKYAQLVSQQLLQVGSPFAAPPAEIKGNIYKEGEDNILALGYFYTASISAAEVDIK